MTWQEAMDAAHRAARTTPVRVRVFGYRYRGRWVYSIDFMGSS